MCCQRSKSEKDWQSACPCKQEKHVECYDAGELSHIEEVLLSCGFKIARMGKSGCMFASSRGSEPHLKKGIASRMQLQIVDCPVVQPRFAYSFPLL